MTSHDSLDPARWTLAQALTWIIYRTPEAVAQTLCTKDVFDVANDLARREGIEQPAMSADLQRRDELLDRLKRGTLPAWGIARGQTEHQLIPSASWDTIDCFYTFDPKSYISPRDIGRNGEGSARYKEVYVIPGDVENLWPPPFGIYAQASHKHKRQAVDAAFRKFGFEALSNMQQKEREEKILEYVKSEYGGLTVSDRFIRDRFSKAKERNFPKFS
jgi:hypothetical protein